MSSSTAQDIARGAKAAFEQSQLVPAAERINALQAIKRELDALKDEILAANAEDLKVSSPLSSLLDIVC